MDNYPWPTTFDLGVERYVCGYGAERLIAAEKGTQKIAVEIKTFSSLSEMEDLEKAVGQYVVYHDVMSKVEPERELYLAVSE